MSILEVFLAFLRLGVTSFGGPIAHIGFFREAFVARRGWVSEQQFAAWLALCQFVPGPASSQLGFLIGLHRAGPAGALAAWCGFTLPSALALTLLALFGLGLQGPVSVALIQGLKLVAVAVVAQAVWAMWFSLCQTTSTRVAALLGFASAAWLAGWNGQIAAILIGGVVGLMLVKKTSRASDPPPPGPALSERTGALLLLLCLALLGCLPWIADQAPALQTFDAFYRAGALVFGGGHVVLPMLESAVVDTGLVSRDDFLVGYGLAQAVPGPLFTFAAWLGALDPALPGWSGALLALVAIFLPGLLLVAGLMPWWLKLQATPRAFALFAGINAAVVGVLAAAWVNPILPSSVHSWQDALIAVIATLWLIVGKAIAWKIVLLSVFLSLAAHWIALAA